MRYHFPTTIIFGSGKISELAQLVKEKLHASRPFLVTDRGIQEAGIVDKIKDQLPGIPIFDEVEQNPKHSTVNWGGGLARQLYPDLVIGLGGGSSLDAAKAIALLAANPGRIEDYEGRERYDVPPLPVLAVPTTCGTGSEVTRVSVITNTSRKFKMSIKGPEMFPAVALVDPDLLMTLPPPLVASTGLDALTHAVEAYTVKQANFITDIFARESLCLIFEHLEDAYLDIKRNKKAREGMMRASLFAGMAFGNSDVGAVHCLAEAVGSLYDTPHGVANAVFLPYVMEFNLDVSLEKYANIGRIAGVQAERDKDAALKLIQRIKELSRAFSIPSMRELGIAETDFAVISQKSFENNSNSSNPKPISAEDYVKILRQASGW
jgi:alcohol dehydrogenase